MALDPVLQQIFDQLPPATTERPDYVALRIQSEALLPLIVGPAGVAPVADVRDGEAQGPAGPVPLRVYRPDGEARGTLHFIHGGGWVVGNLATIDPTARQLCTQLGMVVVASTYRLAPEHPFPAAYEDSLAAALWTIDNLAELGGGPLVIGGDSAGGNLAAVTCLALREKGALDEVAAQLLLYPAVDLRPESANFESRRKNADPGLRSEAMDYLVEDYCRGHDAGDWRISPLAAEALSGLPPALVVVLDVDPLRDEALAYADRLREAGVEVEVLKYDNLAHGFVHMAGIVPAAADATGNVLTRLRAMIDK